MSVFKGGNKLFSLLLLPHKFSVTNLVDMSRIEVFIGGTALIWLELGIPCESLIENYIMEVVRSPIPEIKYYYLKKHFPQYRILFQIRW